MPVCVKPLSCRSCHKRFADEARLLNHQSRAHVSEESKTIQCNICSKRFLNNSALGSHLRTHNDQGSLWECLICKETYCNRDGLKGHVSSHSKNGIFPCPFCLKEFSLYLSIRKHIIKTHKNSGVKCSLCSRYCSTTQKFEEHMLRHATQSQLSCGHCEKQFKRSDKLKEHVKRMHTLPNCDPGDVEVNKEQEEKKMAKRREEKLRDLNEQYLFKCQPCLQGFKRRGMLVNHIAKYHPNINPDEVPELCLPIIQTTRDFYCHLCEKVYKSNAKRKAHILKFHPGDLEQGEQLKNKSFEQPAGTVAKNPEHCPWCHKQYATNAKLLQHMRSQHADKACSIPELRKRGKPRAEGTQSLSVKNKFSENEISDIIDSVANESGCDGSSVDSYGSEMSFVETTGDEMGSPEMYIVQSDCVDVTSPQMFVIETRGDTLCFPEISSIADVEDGSQLETLKLDSLKLEPLMTDDDISLAVCLIMSHANMTEGTESVEEVLVASPQIGNIKVEMSSDEFSDVEKSIESVKVLEETSLTTEDVDLLMAEWLVDLQAGPPLPPNAVPVIQKTFLQDNETHPEVGENVPDLSLMALSSDDDYAESEYHLYDMTSQLPPAQVVYSPYPPH